MLDLPDELKRQPHKVMKFIIAILFAVPTYGTSLIILICYMIYKTKNVKRNVEAAIKFLSQQPSRLGACIEGVSYIQAYAYLSEHGVLHEEASKYFKYSVDIDGSSYCGTLGLEPRGSLAMFTSQDISWVVIVRDWLAKNLNPEEHEWSLADIIEMRSIGYDGLPQFIPGVEYIPEQLFNCNNLRCLYLEDTKIKKIPGSIGKCASLNLLSINGSEIRDFPLELSNCHNIEFIYISKSQISNLPREIGDILSLKELYIDGNKISAIPPQLFRLVNLSSLVLCGNRISSIPPEICELLALEAFNISRNSISIIPESFFKLSRLEYVFMDGNLIEQIPPGLSRLSNLKTLSLAENKMVELPVEIGDLTKLTRLLLHGNRFNSLPSGIVKLTKLSTLTIGHVPDMELSGDQLKWIENLKSDGCVIWLHSKNFTLGSDEFKLEEISQFNAKLQKI